MTEDEMVAWNSYYPGVGDGWEAWCGAIHGVVKSRT